jgi:hypothetical protein
MNEIIYVNKKSKIPLFGLDFLGIIDRGTNIIELKPITICNLKCRYCFVSAGDYDTNFIIDFQYLIEQVQKLADFKGHHDLEIHLAPYGEILLYKYLYNLLDSLWKIKGIKIISMETNGLLLNPTIIKELSKCNLTRINISLNTFDLRLAKYLSGTLNYDMENLLKNIHILLESNINVLIAPVWFPGENREDIEELIQFVTNLRNQGYSNKQIQLGIQKYLVYKTGRKLKKIRPKSWGYFYQQLSELENKYNIKLKLGPKDFGIHSRPPFNLSINKDQIISVEVVSKGRWKNECIGKINDQFCTKILLNYPLEYSKDLLGKNIDVKILKAKNTENLITAYIPY